MVQCFACGSDKHSIFHCPHAACQKCGARAKKHNAKTCTSRKDRKRIFKAKQRLVEKNKMPSASTQPLKFGNCCVCNGKHSVLECPLARCQLCKIIGHTAWNCDEKTKWKRVLQRKEHAAQDRLEEVRANREWRAEKYAEFKARQRPRFALLPTAALRDVPHLGFSVRIL